MTVIRRKPSPGIVHKKPQPGSLEVHSLNKPNEISLDFGPLPLDTFHGNIQAFSRVWGIAWQEKPALIILSIY